MKDKKKVKATEEEAKKEAKTEENGIKLTDEQLEGVTGGGIEYVVDLPEFDEHINYDGMSFSIRLPEFPKG